MKVSGLNGGLLDLWVARGCGQEGARLEVDGTCTYVDSSLSIGVRTRFSPSREWAWGGQIIDREPFGIFEKLDGQWAAGIYRPQAGMRDLCVAYQTGDTLLIAAMRAYVASKFGEEVSDEGC